ncbi:MAG TPA: protease complex subunit PrcB family protein [Gammaproteobacteria bacterium]|nr:protease complex subunit PrcB family protein [Gammaproteobacteria bacterium]
MKRLELVVLILCLVPGLVRAASYGKPGRDFVPGQILVRFRRTATNAAREQAVQALGGRLELHVAALRMTRVRLPAGTSAARAVSAWSARADVAHAQPDYVYRATDAPARTIRTAPQSVRVLAAASQCGGAAAGPSASWIDGRAGLQATWQRIHGTRRPPPAVDFRRYGVVLVSMGRRPTGGYRLALAGGFLPVRHASASLRVNWITPRPGAARARLITRLCLLLQVPRGGYRSIRIVDREGRVRATVRPH